MPGIAGQIWCRCYWYCQDCGNKPSLFPLPRQSYRRNPTLGQTYFDPGIVGRRHDPKRGNACLCERPGPQTGCDDGSLVRDPVRWSSPPSPSADSKKSSGPSPGDLALWDTSASSAPWINGPITAQYNIVTTDVSSCYSFDQNTWYCTKTLETFQGIVANGSGAWSLLYDYIQTGGGGSSLVVYVDGVPLF